MIPKIIHYCWFGGRPLPDSVKVYMDSWRMYLPDFELKQWNESNFDINARVYTREAYYAHKYAFVSDVARLEALTNIGGLYLDTDVLIKRPVPDEMFQHRAFCGFEHFKYAQTGVMACEPHYYMFEEFLRTYDNRHFFRGMTYDLKTNVSVFTDLLIKHGFVMNNIRQEINGMVIYPQIILCGKHCYSGYYDTEETVMLHDFQNAWGNDVLNHKLWFITNAFCTILKWHLIGKKTII